jgi:hypothetical protein
MEQQKCPYMEGVVGQEVERMQQFGSEFHICDRILSHTSAKISFLMSLWTHFCWKNAQDGLIYRMISLFICKFPGSDVIL